MRCNTFLRHSVAVSQQKLFQLASPILHVPVTLQLAHNQGKRRNLFNVLLWKRGTCPTTSCLKPTITTMATAYSSYLLPSSLENKESSPI